MQHFEIRPAQDRWREYGGALQLYWVDRLEPDGLFQMLIVRVHSGLLGCHTYNNYFGLEVIDVFRRTNGDEVLAFFDPLIEQMPTQIDQDIANSSFRETLSAFCQ